MTAVPSGQGDCNVRVPLTWLSVARMALCAKVGLAGSGIAGPAIACGLRIEAVPMVPCGVVSCVALGVGAPMCVMGFWDEGGDR